MRFFPWCRFLLVVAWLSPTVPAEDPAEDANPDPPPLSLRSIHHPTDRFDYDGPSIRTHWIEDNGETVLLVNQGGTWKRFDSDDDGAGDDGAGDDGAGDDGAGDDGAGDDGAGDGAFRVVDAWTTALAALDGLESEAARRIANASAGRVGSTNADFLARAGNKLAIVRPEPSDSPEAGGAGSPSFTAAMITRDASAWRDPTLDPTGKRLGYTIAGDFYVRDLESGKTHRLTGDASPTLLDGRLDWTYQEEIFGRGKFKSFWFSPDGDRVAVMTIDNADVPVYELRNSRDRRGSGEKQRYPLAGDPIPLASLTVFDLRPLIGGGSAAATPIMTVDDDDPKLITGVWWHPHTGDLLFSRSNRLQTWQELWRWNAAMSIQSGTPSTPRASLVFRRQSPGWVDPVNDPGWLGDGGLIWLSDLATGRGQLELISRDGSTIAPLTPDSLHVRSFDVDPDGEIIWIAGTDPTEDDPLSRFGQHIYVLEKTGPSRLLVRQTHEPGWHTMKVAPDHRRWVETYSTVNTPAITQVRSFQPALSSLRPSPIALAQPELKLDGEWIEPELFEIEAPDGTGLAAKLIRSEGQSADGSMGVVIEIYGGPGAPVVQNRWGGRRALERQRLARAGIATLAFDNRSSVDLGSGGSWPIRGEFGKVEFSDTLAAIEWLRDQDWVDDDRIAIRGWSFGGYLTLYVMTHTDLIAAGIAGGSVTNWRSYDAFYTERYMGLPAQNPDGYQAASPVHAADQLHGRVMLVHGELDDNVHTDDTLRMAAALQRAGKVFELMLYPGNGHGIRNRRQAWHLEKSVEDFLMRTIGPDSPAAEKPSEEVPR